MTCRHGTRSGAPAAFYPATAELEFDAQLLEHLAPASIDPRRAGDEERYPAAWGVLVHEAAHAAHSRWEAPMGRRGTEADQAATLLEESRAEHAHVARRPQDRRWLREATRTLIAQDILASMPTTREAAAVAGGLLLARRDAGILDPEETAPLEPVLDRLLGSELLARLREIWQAAHRTADDDHEAMLQHGLDWCQALEGPGGGTPALTRSEVDAVHTALADALDQLDARMVERDRDEAEEAARADAARAAARAARSEATSIRRNAEELAKQVFGPGGAGRKGTIRGTRAPTDAEKAAAGQLARGLRRAAYRERTVTQVSSTTPPGRLSVRQALARDAQLAAGATPTATPWKRSVRRATPTPPLRVGIAVDISGSMTNAVGPIASAAWIVANAATRLDAQSRTATVAFARHVTPITAPGRAPKDVTEFDTKGGNEHITEAIDALTAALDLDRPGAGRLLAIASDGWHPDQQIERATDRVARLRAAGCSVLWLAFAPHPKPLPGVTLVELHRPDQAASVIAQAATAAVRGASTRRR
ncbi:vWA domain-containing protein [Streptomyces triticirhizae]|uniref:vWA domain-containing protein n=1 Tax=Streptomyces triticirhizae TaxID=2483353 RepID=UPI001F2ACB8F|nr:vWA domain-containing protein [Streptomyces triticirhizae]